MKKILPLILSTILLMSIVPTMIFADGIESVVSGNLTWSYDPSAKILTISGNGNMLDYTMDNITGNRPNPYFDRKDEIVSIIVEEGVSSIGDWAFHNYIALENITLPETLKSIGYGAFDNTDLGYIEFPSSLTTLSDIFYMTEPAGIMVLTEMHLPLKIGQDFIKRKQTPQNMLQGYTILKIILHGPRRLGAILENIYFGMTRKNLQSKLRIFSRI